MELSAVSARVLSLFKEISAIPRPSRHEERIADYICRFAEKNGCEFFRDEYNNVFVRVKATAGCEGRAPILLQGHTDMVCEKNADTVHDFMKDGIVLREKDGMLFADGTTLGADNGVAVAIMLFVIEGGVPAHGEIECLFTASEEVGLDGAKGFDYSRIRARRMINLDAGSEASCLVGCAGGVATDVLFAPRYVKAEGELLRISINGLAGGHSGSCIHKGLGNAILLLSRLLAEIYAASPTYLVSFTGGDKDNAIPREASAVIAIEEKDAVLRIAEAFSDAVRHELRTEDAGFSLVCESVPATDDAVMMDGGVTRAVLSFLSCVKNGVLAYSASLPSLVEYSKNTACIRTYERGVRITVSSRSAIERQLDDAMRELDILASLCHAMTHHRDRYPGWAFAGKSEIADRYASCAKELFGTEVAQRITHAGLECGIIKGAIPDMDAVSCGPNLYDLHTVTERMSIDSFSRFAYIIATLLSEEA